LVCLSKKILFEFNSLLGCAPAGGAKRNRDETQR
jgi:hypothetical protein